MKILKNFKIIDVSKLYVIAITETRIPKNVSVIQTIVLNDNSFEYTPVESSAGGTLLYIVNWANKQP